jgi:xylose isomerase
LADGALQAHVDERYEGWKRPLGKEILSGEASLADLDKRVRDQRLDPAPRSGRQEMLENLLNRFT